MPSEIVTVKSNKPLGQDIWRMTVCSSVSARPGQFYMLRCENSAVLLPRPISLCDRQGDTLHFLYKVVGRGTGELSRLNEGGRIRLTGPLGNGFPLEELRGRIALVGGGIGVAPLLYTARILKDRGQNADCYCGFPDLPYLEEDFAGAARSVNLATESGVRGHKGFVTELLDASRYDAILCCGPTPMMKAVVSLCREAGTPVWVSLETKMACGVGACLVCACADKAGVNRRTCKDGPVFRGEEIDFDA